MQHETTFRSVFQVRKSVPLLPSRHEQKMCRATRASIFHSPKLFGTMHAMSGTIDHIAAKQSWRQPLLHFIHQGDHPGGWALELHEHQNENKDCTKNTARVFSNVCVYNMYYIIPVVPHKAVAEVSKIGNL